MTKRTLSKTDMLRRLAGLSRVHPDEAREAFDEFSAEKEAAQNLADVAGDADDAFSALDNILDQAEALVEYNWVDKARLDEARDMLQEIQHLFPAGDWETFTEAHDQAESAVDGYVDVKEEDPYPGKGEAVQDALQEMQAAFEALADAYDALELEAT